MVIISKKKYAVGDLVSKEMSFVHVFDDEAKSKICDSCICSSSKEKKLKKCSGCKVMYYCSEECQKKDWTFGHKYECNVYKKYYHVLQSKDSKCRFVLRLYFALKNKKLATQKTDFQCDDKTVAETFADLLSPVEFYENDEPLMNIFEYFIQLYTECEIQFDKSTMFEVFCKCVFHSDTFCEGEPKISGMVFCLNKSLISHSSSPNISLVYKSGLLTEYRAIKEINIGDELFIDISQMNDEKRMISKKLKNKSTECGCKKVFLELSKLFENFY